jgi:spore coat polysaccharide biosynthesis predicted glycosyltransferase SpsG/L-amino acid N-acyltransferase YncA
VADAQETIRHARQVEASCLVLDGYQFGHLYQQAVKDAGLRLLFVDDYGHAARYCADLVLNQNIYAAELLYANREPDSHLLLGTRYALLRREFWPWRTWQRQVLPDARRVLVTLGGSDPDNVALKAMYGLGLMAVDGLESILVVGGGNPHTSALQQAIRQLALNVRLERSLSDMSAPMLWADVCLAAGGSTCWELALLGLPSVLLVLAANQRANAEGLHAVGAAHSLGWHQDVPAAAIARETERVLRSREIRTAMSRTGQRLVDGYGAQRVVAQMLAQPTLRARPAREEDARLLFEWANDPLTRAMSFHSEPISWAEHDQWFGRVTSQARTLMLIIEVDQGAGWAPCGQVRIDEDGTISLSVAPRYRNRRLALPALRAAMAYGRQRGCQEFRALIKPENERSQRVFVQAGFESKGQAEACGAPCLAYVYRYPTRVADGKRQG